MRRVVVLQEYVAKYRIPFWSRVVHLAMAQGIHIQVAAGEPRGDQALRSDAAVGDFIIPISQREIRILGKRFVYRRTNRATRDVDMVVIEQARRNIDSYRLFLPSFSRRPIVAMWGHGRDYVSTPSRLSRFVFEKLTMQCDWFFAYTNGGQEAVVKAGFPQNKTSVVQNSTDTRELQSELNCLRTGDVTDFAEAHGLTSKTALFIGGLDDSKRLDFLLQAGAAAYCMDSEFSLLIVGEGAKRSLVQDAADRNKWLTYAGSLYGRNKALAMAASQVIAMPGRVGLVAVESLASGRPIVTTDWQWHAPEYEYLTRNETCVVSENAVDAYANALVAVLSDSRRLEDMQENCLRQANQYSIEEMARRFVAGVQGALATRGIW